MRILHWVRLKRMLGLLATERPEPAQQARRIITVQRDLVLPAKAGVCLVVYLFFSHWLEEPSTHSVVLETLKQFFEIYLACTVLCALFFVTWRRWPSELFQWLAFTLGLLDGLAAAGLVIVTGVNSIAFFMFPVLIILNALSIPLAMPQIVLNLLVSAFYILAVMFTPSLNPKEIYITAATIHGSANSHHTASLAPPPVASNPNAATSVTNPSTGATNLAAAGSNAIPPAVRPRRPPRPMFTESDNNPAEDISSRELLVRASVLWLLTLCCYGAQVLSERQREALQEAAEFASREGQLHSAGRLAAEFAHQIKNPLAIINNAAYSLKRSLRDAPGASAQQIDIIQEEVARADKVITQIMGYAQLSEGRVERLKVVDEVERAAEHVFPEAVPSGVKFIKHFAGPFPPLLMQRGHFADIVVNLLLNARQALGEHGTVRLSVTANREHAVEIVVADDGPGIPPDKVERIFEAYFSTKEKGTGLGLTIVKHNAELYGGSVRIQSELGKGARFTVTLPAKSQPRPFLK